MMRKELLLIAQARSSDLVISEMASILTNESESVAIVAMPNWYLATDSVTSVFVLIDAHDNKYLYDTVKLDSYGPYLREQSTEILQACYALNLTSVLCTITGVRPIES